MREYNEGVDLLLYMVSPAFYPVRELQVRMRDPEKLDGYNRDKCHANCPRRM